VVPRHARAGALQVPRRDDGDGEQPGIVDLKITKSYSVPRESIVTDPFGFYSLWLHLHAEQRYCIVGHVVEGKVHICKTGSLMSLLRPHGFTIFLGLLDATSYKVLCIGERHLWQVADRGKAAEATSPI
jgi:hypothetical protein